VVDKGEVGQSSIRSLSYGTTFNQFTKWPWGNHFVPENET